MVTRERFLPLVGAYNFRELGGYPTQDGRVTRWGRLFRSDALHELTDADVDLLHRLGVAQVVDLRTAAEVERSGRGLLAVHPFGYRHLSITEAEGGEAHAAPDAFQSALAERYLWYLEAGAAAIRDFLTLLGDEANLPMVFHCAAGKDRTGVLSALVLDILDVADDVIVEDYVLTASRMEPILDRFRTDPLYAARMASLPAHLFAVEAGNMERFLQLLYRDHGGAYRWALRAGVPAERLAAMRAFLRTDPD